MMQTAQTKPSTIINETLRNMRLMSVLELSGWDIWKFAESQHLRNQKMDGQKTRTAAVPYPDENFGIAGSSLMISLFAVVGSRSVVRSRS